MHEAAARSRVLIIDDEPFVARAFKRYLGAHEVCTAGDGKQALLLLREGPRFDAILCDLAMPDMDGPMVYDAIKAEFPGQERRMIFCSGGAHTTDVHAFIARTKVIVLEKPISAAALRAAIAAVLAL